MRMDSGGARLGRLTEWQEIEGGGQAPAGQKMLLADGEEFPFLEVRRLEFAVQDSADHASAQ